MKVSSTELSDLCKKVFEGMGFPLGDYEDCAAVITWLEMHGLPILAALQPSPAWRLPASHATETIFEDERTALLDARENGGLIYGSLALDLAYLKADAHGFSTVKLLNAQHPRLMLPHLPTCAQRGTSVMLLWREAEGQHVATIAAEAAYPHYAIYRSTATDRAAATVTILCAADVSLRTEPPSPDALVEQYTPADFAARYQHHLTHGLEIDAAIWQHLLTLSKNVLVEATEKSRQRGAGVGA